MRSDLSSAQSLSRERDMRVAVIREEFATLTKDPLIAVVLNQLVYWTQRVKDFDFFLEEEKSLNSNCTIQPRHGWIYKTAEDLIQETMLQVSKSTMLRYLSTLITAGWVDKRSSPTDKWDRTTQYRVNLRKLQEDLLRLGYGLPGSVSLVTSSPLKTSALPELQNETSKFQNEPSRVQNETSNPETTPKTLSEIKKLALRKCGSQEADKDKANNSVPEPIPEAMMKLWKTHVGQDALFLTPSRKTQLPLLLGRYFEKDLGEWEGFCKRIKASRFLMGEGARKWRVSLDWILSEANLRKVLEGNYDDEGDSLVIPFPSLKSESLPVQKSREIRAALDKIQDPAWKGWCEQLPFNPRLSSYVMPWQLEDMVNARFLGIEGNHLAWIVCLDSKTLGRVSCLKPQILTLIQRTYPMVSALRTCLEGEEPQLEESQLEKASLTPHATSTHSSQPQDASSEEASSDPLGDSIHED